jgi:hypothetical protein
VSSRRLLGTVKRTPTDVAAAEAICPLYLVDRLQARRQLHMSVGEGGFLSGQWSQTGRNCNTSSAVQHKTLAVDATAQRDAQACPTVIVNCLIKGFLWMPSDAAAAHKCNSGTWYARRCASAISLPRAVMPSTRPPAATSWPSEPAFVPAWNTCASAVL